MFRYVLNFNVSYEYVGMKYPDGTPMPKSHQEWFESGPIKPEMLDTWLNIIKDRNEQDVLDLYKNVE